MQGCGWAVVDANVVLARDEASEQGEYITWTYTAHVLEQVGMHEQWFWMRRVGRIGMPISRWIKAVLQHSRAAEVVSWIVVSQQGQPSRGGCIGYPESQKCIAAVAMLAWSVPAKQWEDMVSALRFPAYNVSLSPPLNQKSPSSAIY